MHFSLESRDLSPAISVELAPSDTLGRVEERIVHVDHPLFRSRSRILSASGLVVIEGENFAGANLELRSEQLPPPIILALTLDSCLPGPTRRGNVVAHTLPRSFGIFYKPEPNYRFRLEGGRRRRIFEINLGFDYLTVLFERYPALADTPLASVENGAALSLHSAAGALAQSMLDIARDILASGVHGAARAMFIEAKTLELISLQLAELSGKINRSTAEATLSRTQIDRMHHARAELLSRIVDPPSLHELSRIVGTNEYRLKRDFKSLFGQSVFEYLFARRMEMAMRRLRDAEASIEQIAEEVGYSSAAHLSNAFKRHFGFPPSRFRTRRS